jgi:hypothetical protein
MSKPSSRRWSQSGERAKRVWLGRMGLWLLGWMFTSTSAWVTAAHPFHVCIGQMQWNPAESHWEVSLRLHPQDLERAMSAAAGKPISMEDEDFSETALAYLNQQFFICRRPDGSDLKGLVEALDAGASGKQVAESVPIAAQGTARTNLGASDRPIAGAIADDERSTLKWVGMENERGWLWVYLELVPPTLESGTQAWLVHRVLLDTVERQENSVSILIERSNRYALQFKKGTPGQAMRPMP